MKSKFEFYEIVKVFTKDQKTLSFNGKCGYIAAKSEPDLNVNKEDIFRYVVKFSELEFSPMFDENELESTGEFFDKNKIENYGSIRVSVDSNGAGSVKASYQSYSEIEDEMNKSKASKASGHLIEAGMLSNDLDIMYNLIDRGIRHPEHIIRGSAYSALWHLLRRFRDEISTQFLIKTLRTGLSDKNNHVLAVTNCIMEDLEYNSPDIWEQIERYK